MPPSKVTERAVRIGLSRSLTDILADIYIAAFEGDEEKIQALKESFRRVVDESEEIIDSVCDQRHYCDSVLGTYLNSNRRFI